ncbi:hypothetical protein ACROYT_G001416 [Oculina patagonica]
MCVVPRFWLRLFRYSVFTLAALVGLLGLWLFSNQNLFSVKYVGRKGVNTQGDLELRIVTKALRVAGKNKENKTNNAYNIRGNQKKKWMYPKTETGSYGDRGIEMKNQNGKTYKSQTFWKDAIDKLNRDTTKNIPFKKKIKKNSWSNTRNVRLKLPDNFQATTTRNAQASKQSFYFPSETAKVYGESGCADNPWRRGLSELFQAWINISKQHNIEYVLACGSLLGAMRNGDVIPYDSDIDILIDINYWPIMKRLSVKRNFTSSDEKISHLVLQPEFTLNIPVESRKRYDCQGKETPHLVDECSFQEPMGRLIKGNLHIDFFHFYERVHYVDDPSNSNLKQYHKKDFYPFTPCSFMGFAASCPSKPWEILRIYFNTENFEPVYKCDNGTWLDKQGAAAVF